MYSLKILVRCRMLACGWNAPNLFVWVKKIVLLGLSLLGSAFSVLHAQVNISGKPGLIYIPTATLLDDGTFHAGYSLNPVHYAFRFNPAVNPLVTTHNSESIFFVNLVVLPRFELNVNLLRPNGPIQYGARGIGDRQIDVKYGLLTEKANRPAVAIMASIPFGIDNSLITNAIVATKHLPLAAFINLEVSGGFASPLYIDREDMTNDQNSTLFSGFTLRNKRDKGAYYLAGPFGGVKASYKQIGGIMAEWDSQHLNVGAYATLFKHWNVQAGVLNFDQITVATAYTVSLFPVKKRSVHGEAK